MAHAFEIMNVVKRYPDFQLGPLNLELEPGTVLGYVGPNGSGKTTTLHCLTGLVRAELGEMRIFGRPNDLHKPEWKFDIGYVGDVNPFYENWTVARNLKFFADFYPNWSDKRVAELARRFKLPLDKKVKSLSSGNRVKLAVITALAHSPRLLLLDEPTSNLDPVVRSEVLDVLFEVVEDGEKAIFYSTHILSDISRLADDLAFLQDGKILLRAAKDDLTDQWRRISFTYEGSLPRIPHTMNRQQDGRDHQLITSQHEDTLPRLQELGVSNIHETRMTIDEIAVFILKEGDHHVAYTA